MPTIYNYFDYRKYLLDYYTERRVVDAFFSYRFISRQVGTDAGYIAKVFQGQKHLAAASVKKFAQLLKLNKKESDYFDLLVCFGKAKSNTEITHYFEKLLAYVEVKGTRLEAEQYEFYQQWYYTAVREILGFFPFNGDFKLLARMTEPAITPTEARKAVELLVKLGLVKKDGAGGYALVSRFITTGEAWRTIAVRRFQEQTMDLGRSSLERIAKEDRDISTLTVSLSRTGFEEMRERLRQFRRQILEIAEREQYADGAYQLNFQLFPISKRAKKEQVQ